MNLPPKKPQEKDLWGQVHGAGIQTAKIEDVSGDCEPHFAALRKAFDRNFEAELEAGAACAVVIDGQLVVDLWGGSADLETGQPWERDTLVDCRSATKGLTALCLAILADRGLIDFEAPVRRYWPELGIDPTIRQALSHQAGIPIIDDLSLGAILDWTTMAAAIERQNPMWAPGERHGYHGVSFGWLVGEPVRRVSGRQLPEFLRTEVCDRLGVEGFIGTPPEHHRRVATLSLGRPAHWSQSANSSTLSVSDPGLAQRMYVPVLPPLAPTMNDPAFRSASIPVTGATVTARTFAMIFGELACDGGSLLSPGITRALGEVQIEGEDAILGVPVSRTLGYELTPEWADDGRPSHCWGSPGGGGVVTFVDPEARLGFAYVNNAAWGGPPGQDPRAANLTRALYSCL